MKKLLVTAIMAVIGTNAMALCAQFDLNQRAQCQQREAIEDQNYLIQQNNMQLQQLNYQMQMQEMDRYLDNHRSRCYKNHYGIIVCQ